jgi:hypothetical protein
VSNQDKPTVKVGSEQNSELTLDRVSQDKSLKDHIRDAAFMEDFVEVEVHPSTNENDPGHVILNVNGVNQPIFRGVPTKVRRKFIEVLARMKQTSYTQRPTDYINPERSNELIPRTGLAYPFQVLNDPHPKGNAWLRGILAEAN